MDPAVKSILSGGRDTLTDDGGSRYGIRVTSRGGRLLHGHTKDGRFSIPELTVKPGDDVRLAAARAVLELSGFNIPPEAFNAAGIDVETGRRILAAEAKAGRQTGKTSGPVLWLKTAAQKDTPMIASLIKAAADAATAVQVAAEAGEKAQEASKVTDFMNKAKSLAGEAKGSWDAASTGQKAALVAGGVLAGGLTYSALRKKKKVKSNGDVEESGSNLLAIPAALAAAAGGAYLASKGGDYLKAMASKGEKAPESAPASTNSETAASAAAESAKPSDVDSAKAYFAEHGTNPMSRLRADLKFGPLDANKARSQAYGTDVEQAQRYLADRPTKGGFMGASVRYGLFDAIKARRGLQGMGMLDKAKIKLQNAMGEKE